MNSIRDELENEESSYPLIIEEIPQLKDVFPKLGVETPSDPFTPYVSALERPRAGPNDIGLILHSSGSTGFPKAIPQPYLTMVHWAAFRP